MPLQDALDGKYSGLLNRDYPMFAGCGSSISVRLEVRTVTCQQAAHIVTVNILVSRSKGTNHGDVKSRHWIGASLLNLSCCQSSPRRSRNL
jgi:hypothetical protein